MRKLIFPTKDEITIAIGQCEKKLLNKKLNQFKYMPLKEGYIECIRMMKDRILNYDNPEKQFFIADEELELDDMNRIYTEQMLPIKKLKTEIGRTIAVLCNDFLNGQDDDKIFLSKLFIKNNPTKSIKKVIDNYDKKSTITSTFGTGENGSPVVR